MPIHPEIAPLGWGGALLVQSLLLLFPRLGAGAALGDWPARWEAAFPRDCTPWAWRVPHAPRLPLLPREVALAVPGGAAGWMASPFAGAAGVCWEAGGVGAAADPLQPHFQGPPCSRWAPGRAVACACGGCGAGRARAKLWGSSAQLWWPPRAGPPPGHNAISSVCLNL